jgi:steroid 5-alpha reductase family enzyme
MSGAPDPIPGASPIFFIASAAAFLALAMALAWVAQRRSGKSGWADVAWTFGLGIAGAVLAIAPIGGHADATRQCLVAAFALIWALRLGGHILLRTLGGGEDPRYRQLALEWGEAFPRRLFWFLQLQAACALLLALSIFAAAHSPAPELRWNDFAGIALLIAAITGEAMSDAQLMRFRSNPANSKRICDTGLWALSRHPNYFFQWLGWLAYPVIAVDFSGGYGLGWLAVSGPLFMYWLLVHVSGVPPLEAHMLRSRGGAYRLYQARVNAFFPGLSRKESVS